MRSKTLWLAVIALTLGCSPPKDPKPTQADKDAAASYSRVRHRNQSDATPSATDKKRKDGRSAWQTEFDNAQKKNH